MKKAGNLRIKLCFLPAFTHRLRGVSQKKALAIASAFFSYICLAASYIASQWYLPMASDIALRAVLE